MILILLFLFLVACAPEHKGWTRAEVETVRHSQQTALDKDREACNTEGQGRPLLHQLVLGRMELNTCLERKGWKRVP